MATALRHNYDQECFQIALSLLAKLSSMKEIEAEVSAAKERAAEVELLAASDDNSVLANCVLSRKQAISSVEFLALKRAAREDIRRRRAPGVKAKEAKDPETEELKRKNEELTKENDALRGEKRRNEELVRENEELKRELQMAKKRTLAAEKRAWDVQKTAACRQSVKSAEEEAQHCVSLFRKYICQNEDEWERLRPKISFFVHPDKLKAPNAFTEAFCRALNSRDVETHQLLVASAEEEARHCVELFRQYIGQTEEEWARVRAKLLLLVDPVKLKCSNSFTDAFCRALNASP